MQVPVTDAFLQVFKPGNNSSTPDIKIADDEIEGVRITERIQDQKDTARFTITNTDGQYTDEITSGDHLVLSVDLGDDDDDGSYSSSYGTEEYGGIDLSWHGIMRAPTIEQTAARIVMTAEADDYVFGVCSMRDVFDVFEDEDISSIVKDLINDNAPELDTELVASVNDTASVYPNGRNLLDLLVELQRRGDAFMRSFGTSLVFKPIGDLSSEFTVDGSDYSAPLKVRNKDDDLVNVVRVDGGEDHAVDDEQPTQDGYSRVTDASGTRITHQISTRKSEIDRVEVWTRRDITSEDGIVLRLQADDNGSPIDPSNKNSDIAREQLSQESISDDDYTTFIFPEHNLHQANPWLLIESDGSTGHEIGIDTATNEPTYKAHYPFPISIRLDDGNSIDEYRERHHRIRDESIRTFSAARERARGYLRHNDAPDTVVKFEAHSTRAHTLDPGDVVTLEESQVGATGEYIVYHKQIQFVPPHMRTNLSLREVSTV